jgi:hypothetical protein
VKSEEWREERGERRFKYIFESQRDSKIPSLLTPHS